MATATFGAGASGASRRRSGRCRACSTAVGYAGGSLANPTYEQVCSGATGHAEVVQVEYDPGRSATSSSSTCSGRSHDPTQLNRQGPDVGTQYRSAIFFHDAEQAEPRAPRKARGRHLGPLPPADRDRDRAARTFWRAEEYHQQYLEKRGLAHCALP